LAVNFLNQGDHRREHAVNDRTQPSADREADREEARLVSILAACRDKVTAARQALSDPAHSMLTPEYTKLQNDHEMARVEWAKAAAALREHQERRRSQAGENSK
jgi:hypothetical protein